MNRSEVTPMRAVSLALLILSMAPLAASPPAAPSTRVAQAPDAAQPCGASANAHVRTTLYFGLTRPAGTVSEREWEGFLRTEVTPRFPDGLTVLEAEGQWRRPDGNIERERSKVLLLVHDDTPQARDVLALVVSAYKREFEQESVLWESSVVCATF
jgi:hypothetical protein